VKILGKPLRGGKRLGAKSDAGLDGAWLNWAKGSWLASSVAPNNGDCDGSGAKSAVPDAEPEPEPDPASPFPLAFAECRRTGLMSVPYKISCHDLSNPAKNDQ
jgi:hypothetical protein